MEPHRDQPREGVAPIVLVAVVALVGAGGWFLGTVRSPTDAAPVSSLPAPSSHVASASSDGIYKQLYPIEDHEGNLPDGTEFLARFGTDQPSGVRKITASILVRQGGDEATSIGDVRIMPDDSIDRPTDNFAYQRSFEGWTLVIEPNPDGLPVSEGALDGWLDDHIINLPGRKHPAYRLLPPLRWASDSESTPEMRVEFGSYAVGRGCDTDAIACSETHAVQLLPTGPGLDTEASVTSPAPRPPTDPGYLDPGPLAARKNHRVMWTESEVIVWGGDNGQETFTDGAAYDPESETWRWLPDSPFETGSVASSVWADDRLIAFNRDVTAQYLPSSNEWQVLGSGVLPPGAVDLTVWSGSAVYAWADGIYRFDTSGWTKLPSPGANPGTAWETALVAFDETIYAVYLPWGDCSARQIARWTGSNWSTIPEPPLSGSDSPCADPRQVIALYPLLYAWSEGNQPFTVYDPRTHTWSAVGVLPQPKPATTAQPVGIDYRILLAEDDQARLYSPTTNAWMALELPGSLTPSTSVWTGEELINWGRSCCYETPGPGWGIDAWRLSIDP